jgi:hypothetical protein
MLHVHNPDLAKSMTRIVDAHAHHTHDVTVARRAERQLKWARRWAALRSWFGARSPDQSSWPSVGAVRPNASSAPENVIGLRTPGTPPGAICMPRATT